MGLSNIIKSVKHNLTRTFSNNNGPMRFNGELFYPMGMGDAYGRKVKPLEAFCTPEVGSILNKRATAHSKIKIQVVSKSTGKPVVNAASKLLANPNWMQNTKEFISQANLFRDLYGNEYNFLLFGTRPEMSKAMYSLIPEFMKVEYDSKIPYYREEGAPEGLRYVYEFNNVRSTFTPDEIIHLNDNRVSISNQGGDVITGQSKLDSIHQPINNIIAAYEARGVMIRSRGALGILSNDSEDIGGVIDIDDTEKENLQNEYSKYGVMSNQWHIIVTRLKLRWQQMGVDVDKLKLFDEVREDAIKVAEAFNYPPELLGKDGSSNLFGDNKKQSEKAWYENSIIPEAQMRIDAFNSAFSTDKSSWHIVGSFDHLSMFQDNIKEKAASFTLVTNALSKLYMDKAITLEEYQAELRRYGFLEDKI